MGINLPLIPKPRPKSAAPNESGTKQVTIRLEPIESATVYYANYIEVGNSPLDFTMTCARLPSKFSVAKLEEVKESGYLVVEPEI